MDRRQFVTASAASLACCCCRERAWGRPASGGCAMSAAKLADARSTMQTADAAGLTLFRDAILSKIVKVRERYGLRPGASFVEDVPKPNAYAVPDVLVPGGEWGGTDGTLLLGRNLMFQKFRDALTDILPRAGMIEHAKYTRELDVLVIIAHEFGHILQFKNGFAPGLAWEMEPHADFMAGWAIDKSWVSALFADGEKSFESAVQLIFASGDTDFDNPQHHGEPRFRAAMVLAGHDSHDLPIEAAFEKGARMAGLS
jgi:hypothetical protein